MQAARCLLCLSAETSFTLFSEAETSALSFSKLTFLIYANDLPPPSMPFI